MAKSSTQRTDVAVTTAANRAKVRTDSPEGVTEQDVARRAYGLYLARGCEHGHDVEDWLQAEQELRRLIAA